MWQIFDKTFITIRLIKALLFLHIIFVTLPRINFCHHTAAYD